MSDLGNFGADTKFKCPKCGTTVMMTPSFDISFTMQDQTWTKKNPCYKCIYDLIEKFIPTMEKQEALSGK